jgi:hypothetical protein
MPFDPNIPAPNTKMKSAEMRNQFNALKALIDALTLAVTGLQAQVAAHSSQFASLIASITALAELVPIGGIIPWAKNSFGVALTLPENFMECNGQAVADAESPLDGETLPNLNGGQYFLRGNALSGDTGGSLTHTHDIEIGSGFDGVNVDNGGSGQSLDANPKSTGQGSSLPPYYEVVYVMRVK